MKILSPLTHKPTVKLVRKISATELIQSYQSTFHITIKKLLKGVESISLYQCTESNFSFYYPFTLAGDGNFYSKLEKFSWYYMPWKWEHEKCLEHVGKDDSILEVGCGRGDFIAESLRRGYRNIEGIELNETAVKQARRRKLPVLYKNLSAFKKTNLQKYDVVVSFQVLEHVPKPLLFLSDCLAVLKPGGKLIIAVPNNDSFLMKELGETILNMPPHHMGLWNIRSLLYLQKVLPIIATEILFEPLSSIHGGVGYRFATRKMSEKIQIHSSVLSNLFKKIWFPFVNFTAKQFIPLIHGHSIMVVYQKNEK